MDRRPLLFTAVLAGLAALATAAWAADKDKGDVPHTAAHHGLEGWVPRKIADEGRDRKEIEKLLEELHVAYRNGDQQAVAARMDFPVFMVTDDWKGDVISGTWDRDTWTQRTAPLFLHPAHELQRAHNHNVFVISDSLASVDDEQSVILGKKKVTIRSSSILVRIDGRWLVKSTVEGGWGDTRLVKPGEVAEPAPDAASYGR